MKCSPAGPQPFRMHRKDEVLCCSIEGEFTLNASSRFREAMEKHLESRDCKVIIMDLEQVRFMDSTGIGSLVALNTRAHGMGIALHLLKPSPQVRKVLELVQLAHYFSMVESLETLSLPSAVCSEE